MAYKAISNPILVLDEQSVPCAESTNTMESFGYRAAALEFAGQRGNPIDVLIGGGSEYFPLGGDQCSGLDSDLIRQNRRNSK